MKRITALSAVAVAGALLLSACGGGGSNTTESGKDTTTPEEGATGDSLKTSISILAPSYSESSKSDWEAIIAEFNKSYPDVEVNLQIEGWDDFSSKVQARIQAKDYPDILNDNTFSAAAEGGLLYPIDEVLSPEVMSAIEPALLKNGLGADGTQWAAPDVASSRLLAYNTKLLEEAGVSEVPTTWDGLMDAAKKVQALGGDTYGYGLPLGREEAQVESSLWLWGAGGDWDVDGNLVADQPTVVEAFTQMKAMIDADAVQPDPGATNRQQAADLFNNGKLGMMVSHSGLLGVTRSDFPDVEFALAPVPSKEGEPVAIGVTDFILAFDNGDADKKAATSAFLDLLYSDALYETWYQGTGLLPVTKSMIEKGKANDADNATFYDALEYVKFLPVGNPQWDSLQAALQGTAGSIQSDGPESVVQSIQAQLDAGM
ncbi:extracellular solute-binding protein [Actinomycetaceae bacterium MB13-C1-2]|nr:extracellular solute-binding protein [Actinomycetaceae bacterium MB13-C1-2]